MLVSHLEQAVSSEQAVSPRPCRYKDIRLTTKPKPFPHAVSAVPLPGPPKPTPFTLAVGGPGAGARRRQHPAGAKCVAPKAVSLAERAMDSPQPWAMFFAGKPPPVPRKPAPMSDANLPEAVSHATLPVVLEEGPEDGTENPALNLFMEQEMTAVTDEDAVSVCSKATTASEVPNVEFQLRIAAGRWARNRQPLPSIDATQAVCPGIDAPDVIVPLVGAAAMASISLRAAGLGLTQSAHAEMPKATRRQGLCVVMPSSKGKGRSKGKKP
jgi:hypothetical protein